VVDHFKTRDLWKEIQATEIGEEVVLEIWVRMEKLTYLKDLSFGDPSGDLTTKS
jgi:hypothetical protein